MSGERRGARRALEQSGVYTAFQRLVAKRNIFEVLREDYVPETGDASVRVLDIGCGPGVFLTHFPLVAPRNYVGIDPNPRYTATGRERHPGATFLTGTVDTVEVPPPGGFDLVTLVGVMHHLGDDDAVAALEFARRHVRAGGRVFTFDPVLLDAQRWVARRIIRADRGKCVRVAEGYLAMLHQVFGEGAVSHHVRHDLLRVPYDHFITVTTPGA